MTEHNGTLYLTDQQIAAKLGVSDKSWRVAVLGFELQRGSGFPRHDPLFPGKRLWPAVEAFLLRRAGLKLGAPSTVPDGEERDFNAPAKTTNSRRAGPRMAASR
ncbi:MAG: hypothetical protein Q7R45_08305 [Sulfuricaulis sp.]|nr:hypothetical protein [Sulfuricaulis sp.]